MSSKLIFGAVSIGVAYGLPRAGAGKNALPEEGEVAALVEHALVRGMTTFDTAPAYGVSEERLGRTLGARGSVWTKVIGGDPSESLDASLAKLQRPRVELFQWHNWTAKLADDTTWTAAWRKLRGDARCAALGATTYGVPDAVAAAKSGFFDVVQCEFNLLNQGVVNALAEYVHAGRVKVAVRSVYLQGALTDEGRALPHMPVLQDGVEKAREVSEGKGGLTRLALRAAVDHPAIAHVLVGIDRKDQIDAALALAAGAPLTGDERAALARLDLRGDPACDPRNWPR